jgi:hypothetical protein
MGMSKEKGGKCASCHRNFGRHDQVRAEVEVGNVKVQRHSDCPPLKEEK